VRDIGKGIGQESFVPLQRSGLLFEQRGYFVDLIFQDAEIALPGIPDLQRVVPGAYFFGITGQLPDLPVLFP